MVPEGLESFGPEERRWVYKLLRLNVFADVDGALTASWMFTRAGVVQRDTRKDEGNAYARLGEGSPGWDARKRREPPTRGA